MLSLFSAGSVRTFSFLVCIISALGLSACGDVRFSAVEDNKKVPDIVDPIPLSLRDVQYSNTVVPSNNKVDIVVVLDDSKSMLADNQKLAARLTNFVTSLQNSSLDWQACLTLTNAVTANLVWGASMYWQNSTTYSTGLGFILKKGQANLPTIFSNTINYIGAGWAGTEDERAIKAAYHHAYNGDYHYANASGCYRADAAIAYIIISDEDERSVGGDKTQVFYSTEHQPLENEDLPANFVSNIKSTFGNDKRFTVNSIIVKPGDNSCLQAQDVGAKSHFGTKYAELANLTGGGIGSICDADYSTNLNLFADKIISSLSSIPLECTPAQDPIVSFTPSANGSTFKIQGANLTFDTPIQAGTTINIEYKCNDSRAPSSIKGAPIKAYEEEGFFARAIRFLKNLF
jgi:hypothetical protein